MTSYAVVCQYVCHSLPISGIHAGDIIAVLYNKVRVLQVKTKP
jgi:hypothetical protein